MAEPYVKSVILKKLGNYKGKSDQVSGKVKSLI